MGEENIEGIFISKITDKLISSTAHQKHSSFVIVRRFLALFPFNAYIVILQLR